MEAEFYHSVVELFNRFINDVDYKMRYYIQRKTTSVHLQAPEFVIPILVEGYSSSFGRPPEKSDSGYYFFQGLKIEPTYEMAIILFHKHYPLYREEWMLKKIPLDPPVTLKEEWYSKTVFKMKAFFPGTQGRPISDN